MAAFSSIGLGLLIGAMAGGTAATVVAKKRAPRPGASNGANAGTALIEAPTAPDANKAASDSVAAGNLAAGKTRKRAARGAATATPRMRLPGARAGAASPTTEPRALIGY